MGRNIKRSIALLSAVLLFTLICFSFSACSDAGIVKDITTAEVGSYIRFGAYEQDNNTANGNEPIIWLVLAKENDRLLIISRDILAYRQFHSEHAANTVWENCDLRTWLNGEFLQDAFSVGEQDSILITSVGVDISSHGDEFQGSDTWDKIFILSASEAAMYFAGDSDRVAQNTKAVKEYLPEIFKNPLALDQHWWWLRTRAYSTQSDDGSMLAASDFVDDNGFINDIGLINIINTGSHTDYNGVRPVLWIDLNCWQE